MFRRRSSSRHQPLNTTPSASAQTAATRAFIANRDANLSSAAAAAALRSHTPPPTTPGNVQTKRMLQRQLSNSSRGSSVGGLHHGSQSTLHRSSSSGSMASRTFRDQSPGRTQTTAGKTQNAPPVPPIPQSHPNRDTPPHRSSSVQPTSHSSTTSPLRKLVGGRGASLDRGHRMTASPANPRTAPKGTSPELERPGSRTSINFSYPINARPNSPPQSPVDGRFSLSSGNTSHTPPSLSPVETAGIQQSINDATNRKVKLRPKTTAPASKEGSHFAHKTMGSRPTGTAIATDVQSKLHDGTAGEEDMSGVSVTDFAPHHEQHAAIDQDQSQKHITNENGDSLATRPRPKKRPSMVMEDHEGEELAEAADASQEGDSSFPTTSQVPVQSSETSSEVNPAREALVIYPPKNIQVTPSVASAYSLSPSSSQSSPGDRLTADPSIDSQLPQRQPSVSPNRSARFSAQLTVGSESPLHEPPPRSLSPAKPALKQSSSPDRRIHFGQTPSEISDVTSVASDDGSHTGSRRRTAKVSFDDEAEVFGMAASPPTSPEPTNRDQSPVEKTKPRKWFNIGKKKSLPRDVSEDDEFESVLRPRPALPNFGSIRGHREEETVIVADNDGDSDSSSDDAVQPHGLLSSSNSPVEGKSVDDYSNHARAVQPDISLPTTNSNIVTKESVDVPVEGTNTVSMRGFDHLPPVQEEQDSERSSVAAVVPAAQTDKMITNGEIAKLPHESLQETLPIIAIQPATPAEEPRNSIDMDEMPGGFPSYVSEGKTLPKSTTIHDNAHTMDKRIENVEDNDDDSEDSIYSDAAEDPEDMDGGLFGSINAIVDSPVPAKTLFPKEVPESPTRGAMRADSLSDLSEPVSSPSLETIHPRMPATPSKPMQGQANGSANMTEGRFGDNFGDSSSSWPLNDNTKPFLPASVRQQVAAKTAEPTQGSHLRKALGKESDQREQASPKQPMRTASGTAVSPSAKQKPLQGTLPTKQVSKTVPQSKTFPAGFKTISANDSDSDSSFKRTRRSSRASNNGPYSMKRTMRAGRPVSLANPETFTDRTMSPPRTSSMRMTMRSPTFDRSSGMSSLRDKSGRSRPRSSMLLSNTRSRVGESDADSRGGRLLFQSRFADSSDEDEPGMSRLAPVRGIPRRKGRYDGESTDLDDSSDDEVGHTMRNGVSKDSAKPLSPEDVEAIFVQPKKKSGIFSRLRSPAQAGGKDGKVRKSMAESPARRDTPLERSRLELARMREDAPSPKLHKRQKATRMASDTWPLPLETSSKPALTSNKFQDRPLTSDGITRSLNGDSSGPSFNWHGTPESIDSRVTSAASEVVLGRTGKKKRFPMLRRAFGLRD